MARAANEQCRARPRVPGSIRTARGAGAPARAFWFLRPLLAGLGEMLLHGLSGGDGIARTNRLVDAAMHLGGVTQLLDRGPLCGSAALLVKQGRHHFHQRRNDRIARRRGHAAVKVDVVHEKNLRIVERRKQAGHFLGEALRADLLSKEYPAWKARTRR